APLDAERHRRGHAGRDRHQARDRARGIARAGAARAGRAGGGGARRAAARGRGRVQGRARLPAVEDRAPARLAFPPALRPAPTIAGSPPSVDVTKGAAMERILGRYAEAFYAALRVVAGLMFAVHGAQKILGLFGGHKVPLGSP